MASDDLKQAESLELPKSLYSRYLQERESKEVLEQEHGFVVYQFLQTHCYIVDIYVLPEHRKSGLASQMADQVAGLAKSKGYTKLLGSVKPSAAGSTVSMKALLGYGFHLMSASEDAIFLEKLI